MILYVPKLCRILILTGGLTKCLIAIIHVCNMCKMISNYCEGNIIMIGQKYRGLWCLNQSTLNHPNVANLVATTCANNRGLSKHTLTLHARLGHVSVRTIKKMSGKSTWFGAPCAKKVCIAGVNEATFIKETKILVRLNHPNIVNFLCCGNDPQKGHSFIAMDLMDMSLSEFIKLRAKDRRPLFSPIVALDTIV